MNDAPQLMDQTDKKMLAIVLIVAGVICLVAVGAAAVAFYTVNATREKQNAALATEQAYATSTAVSVASTAVHQATHVAGYQFFDDFKDNKNEWETSYEYNDYWKGMIEVRDGVYAWDVNGFYESDSAYSWRNYKNAESITDFDVAVDAKLATPKAQSLCYGLVFRCSSGGVSNGAYIFSVCDDRQFKVEFGDDQDDEILTPWTYSDSIRSGDWNTLAVSARGGHFVLSINNVIVSEFTDERRESGYVHLMVQFYEKVPGTIMFDNFGLQPK